MAARARRESARRVSDCVTALLRDQPFFGSLALRLPIRPDPARETLASDGREIRYSPDWVAGTDADLIKTAIGRVVLACALKHHTRRGEREPGRWQQASQLVTHGLLRDAGFKLPPDAEAWDGISVEQAYDRLPQPQEGGGQGSDGPPSPGGGSAASGPEPDSDDDDGTGDDHDDETQEREPHGEDGRDDDGGPDADDGNAPAGASDDGDPQAEDGPGGEGKSDAPASCDPSGTGEVMDSPGCTDDNADAGQAPADVSAEEQAWDEAMHQALNLAKAQGKAPGAVQETIRDAHRSTLDWRSLLRRYMTDAAARDYSWSVPNRRFIDSGLYLPSIRSEGMGTLAVIIDTSGSVDSDALAAFWSEVREVAAEIEPERIVVLPARREAVETEFLKEIRHAARLAIYRAMAAADPAPRIAFKDHKRAAETGIALPVPPAELRPWRPGIADIDDWRDTPAYAPVGAGTLVMAVDPEPQDQQAFWRAAERAGIAGAGCLFERDTRFEGYGWYDALARVTELSIEVTETGVTHAIDVLREAPDPVSGVPTAPGLPDTLARPDRIDMHLRIERDDGPPETMTVPADVAFVGEDGAWVEDARPLVARDSKLTPMQLTRLLHASYFSPSDDASADSYDTQSARFDQDATHLAIKLLASEDEARRHTIAEAVWRDILWVMPRDREVSIKVSGGKVAVEFGPESPAPEGVAA